MANGCIYFYDGASRESREHFSPRPPLISSQARLRLDADFCLRRHGLFTPVTAILPLARITRCRHDAGAGFAYFLSILMRARAYIARSSSSGMACSPMLGSDSIARELSLSVDILTGASLCSPADARRSMRWACRIRALKACAADAIQMAIAISTPERWRPSISFRAARSD